MLKVTHSSSSLHTEVNVESTDPFDRVEPGTLLDVGLNDSENERAQNTSDVSINSPPPSSTTIHTELHPQNKTTTSPKLTDSIGNEELRIRTEILHKKCSEDLFYLKNGRGEKKYIPSDLDTDQEMQNCADGWESVSTKEIEVEIECDSAALTAPSIAPSEIDIAYRRGRLASTDAAERAAISQNIFRASQEDFYAENTHEIVSQEEEITPPISNIVVIGAVENDQTTKEVGFIKKMSLLALEGIKETGSLAVRIIKPLGSATVSGVTKVANFALPKIKNFGIFCIPLLSVPLTGVAQNTILFPAIAVGVGILAPSLVPLVPLAQTIGMVLTYKSTLDEIKAFLEVTQIVCRSPDLTWDDICTKWQETRRKASPPATEQGSTISKATLWVSQTTATYGVIQGGNKLLALGANGLVTYLTSSPRLGAIAERVASVIDISEQVQTIGNDIGKWFHTTATSQLTKCGQFGKKKLNECLDYCKDSAYKGVNYCGERISEGLSYCGERLGESFSELREQASYAVEEVQNVAIKLADKISTVLSEKVSSLNPFSWFSRPVA